MKSLITLALVAAPLSILAAQDKPPVAIIQPPKITFPPGFEPGTTVPEGWAAGALYRIVQFDRGEDGINAVIVSWNGTSSPQLVVRRLFAAEQAEPGDGRGAVPRLADVRADGLCQRLL